MLSNSKQVKNAGHDEVFLLRTSLWQAVLMPVREAFSATFTGKIDGEAVARDPLNLIRCLGFLLISALLVPVVLVLLAILWVLWIVSSFGTLLARNYAGNDASFDAEGVVVSSRRLGRKRMLPWASIHRMQQSMDGPVLIWSAVMSDGEVVPLPMASATALVPACKAREIPLEYRFRRQ